MSLLLPIYLLGLAGLALPWALHRFSNQVPEERSFPSIRFLEPTRPPVSRKRRLRYRVLFAARWLALIALCLLFAEPWLSRLGNLGEARHLHIVAIDTSLSMQTADRWQQARDQARQRIDELPEGDLLRLLSFDTSVTTHGEASQVHAEALSSLNTLVPGFASSDYGVLMQWLDNGAEEAELPVQVTVITDVQRSALPDRINALTASRLDSLDVVDVSRAGQSNVSLSADVRTLDDVTARIRVLVAASKSGASDDDGPVAVDRTVVISHGDRQLARQDITLEPGQQESILFDAIPLPSVADPIFRIALQQGDDLPVDDAIDAVVRQPEALSVALGAFSGSVDSNAAAFVTTALQTNGEAQVDTTSAALSDLANQNRHAVIFTDLAEFDEVPEALARFLDVGGNALLVNRVSQGARPAIEQAGTRVSTMGRLDDSHPLALGDIEWHGVRFHAVPEIALDNDDRILIETTERQPVLIERPVPRGSLLLLNDTLDGLESNLPVHPGFVSMMRSILFEFARNAAIPEEAIVGESIALPGNIQILDPQGGKLLELAALAEAHSFVFESPGLHTVLDSRGEHRLAAVLDPFESDLRSLNSADIEAWKAGGSRDLANDTAAIVASGDTLSDADAESEPRALRPPLPGAESDQGLVLWPWLIPILAVLLMGESLLGNQRLTVRRDGS